MRKKLFTGSAFRSQAEKKLPLSLSLHQSTVTFLFKDYLQLTVSEKKKEVLKRTNALVR